MYLVCNTTLCALKQPRDFCCVCVEAKEVPALLVVEVLGEELGLACCEQQSWWVSGPLGEGGQVGQGGVARRLAQYCLPRYRLHRSPSLAVPRGTG